MSVRRTHEDFSSSRLESRGTCCSLLSLSRTRFISLPLPLSLSFFWYHRLSSTAGCDTRYTKCTVHARSTFATSSLLFLLFHLLLLLFIRPRGFSLYLCTLLKPCLAATGRAAKRKRANRSRKARALSRDCSCMYVHVLMYARRIL